MCEKPILVSAGMDATIRFWDLATQKNYLVLDYKDSQINNMCITPDGNQLAIAAWQSVRVYSLRDPTLQGLHTFTVHDQKNVTTVGFEADGRWMYTAGEDGTAKIWDMRATQLNCQRIFQVKTPVHSVALHPNQTELIVADSAGTLYVWDLRTDNETSLVTDVEISEYIVHVDIDKMGRQCAAVTNRGHLFIWNIGRGEMSLTETSTSPVDVENLDSDRIKFMSPRLLENNPYLTEADEEVTAEEDEENAEDEDAVATLLSSDQDENKQKNLGETNCSPDQAGSMPPLAPPPALLTETPTNIVKNSRANQQQNQRVYSNSNYKQNGCNQWQLLLTPQQPQQYLGASASSAASSNSNSSLLKQAIKIRAHSTFALKCRFRPDGLVLATTSADQSAKAWSVTNHKLLNTYSIPTCKWVWDCAFTFDSKYILTGSSDGFLRMWDMDTHDIVRTFQGHSLGVTAMVFRDVP